MKKNLLHLLILISSLLFGIKEVNAVSESYVTHEWIPNFFNHKVVEGKPTKNFAQLAYVYAGGTLAYCIEPGVTLYPGNYDYSSDMDILNLSEEDKKYLELVGVYGYNYPGHQTVKYYAATQELIWEKFGLKSIYWTTKADGGDIIDLSNEKRIIKELINQHDSVPSFYEEKIILNYKEETKLYDTNKVLENYQLESYDKSVTLEGNELKVDTSEIKNIKIKLKKKNMDEGVSLVYTKEGSQNVAFFKLSSPKYLELNFEIIGKEIEIEKIDEDSKKPIQGVNFAIYDSTTNEEVYNGVTDVNGILRIPNLYKGDFYIIEKKSADGYIIDNSKYYFKIGEDDNNSKICISNKKIVVPNTGVSRSQAADIICILLIISLIGSIVYEKVKK